MAWRDVMQKEVTVHFRLKSNEELESIWRGRLVDLGRGMFAAMGCMFLTILQWIL